MQSGKGFSSPNEPMKLQYLQRKIFYVNMVYILLEASCWSYALWVCFAYQECLIKLLMFWSPPPRNDVYVMKFPFQLQADFFFVYHTPEISQLQHWNVSTFPWDLCFSKVTWDFTWPHLDGLEFIINFYSHSLSFPILLNWAGLSGWVAQMNTCS